MFVFEKENLSLKVMENSYLKGINVDLGSPLDNFMLSPKGDTLFLDDIERETTIFVGKEIKIIPKVETELAVTFLADGNAMFFLLRGAFIGEMEMNGEMHTFVVAEGISSVEQGNITRSFNSGFKDMNVEVLTVERLALTASVSPKIVEGNYASYLCLFKTSVIANGLSVGLEDVLHDYSEGQLLSDFKEKQEELEKERQIREATVNALNEKRRQQELKEYHERKKKEEELEKEKTAKRKPVKRSSQAKTSKRQVKKLQSDDSIMNLSAMLRQGR